MNLSDIRKVNVSLREMHPWKPQLSLEIVKTAVKVKLDLSFKQTRRQKSAFKSDPHWTHGKNIQENSMPTSTIRSWFS